jgi:hypothetical protein
VAGGSASTLLAGDGEDLLIAGFTSYDTEPALAKRYGHAGRLRPELVGSHDRSLSLEAEEHSSSYVGQPCGRSAADAPTAKKRFERGEIAAAA